MPVPLLIFLLLISISFSQIIAVVNGRKITSEEVSKAFKTYWEEILHLTHIKPQKEDRQKFLAWYIKSILVEDIAREIGIEVSEEEIDRLLKKWGKRNASGIVRKIAKYEILMKKIEEHITEGLTVSESEIEAYYTLNRREFLLPSRLKLLRIVVSDKKTAWDVYRRLKRGEEIRPSEDIIVGRERWYSLQALPRRIKRKLYPYKVGKVSKPIKVRGGYLILKITDKQKGGFLPLEEVRDEVKKRIIEMKKEEVMRRWFRDLMNYYEVKLYSFHF